MSFLSTKRFKNRKLLITGLCIHGFSYANNKIRTAMIINPMMTNNQTFPSSRLP